MSEHIMYTKTNLLNLLKKIHQRSFRQYSIDSNKLVDMLGICILVYNTRNKQIHILFKLLSTIKILGMPNYVDQKTTCKMYRVPTLLTILFLFY